MVQYNKCMYHIGKGLAQEKFGKNVKTNLVTKVNKNVKILIIEYEL